MKGESTGGAKAEDRRPYGYIFIGIDPLRKALVFEVGSRDRAFEGSHSGTRSKAPPRPLLRPILTEYDPPRPPLDLALSSP